MGELLLALGQSLADGSSHVADGNVLVLGGGSGGGLARGGGSTGSRGGSSGRGSGLVLLDVLLLVSDLAACNGAYEV